MSTSSPSSRPLSLLPPQLKLFDPTTRQQAGLTLREAYEQKLLPALREEGIKPRTIEEDFSAIRKWETRTMNPGILSGRDVLTDQARRLLSEFLAEKKLGRATIEKTFRHLQKIFNRLAPSRKGNPNGCGLIRRAPVMPRLKKKRRERRATRRVVAPEKLRQVFEACASALPLRPVKAKTGVFPADVWRAALVLDHFYGLRTRDLFRLSRENVFWTPEHPDCELPHRWPHGWLCYVTEKTGVELVLPLPGIVRQHLVAILAHGHERLFPAPLTKRAFYHHWNHITGRAGVTVHFQELRKTANTAWNKLWPGLGKAVLGHVPEGVNETYYSDPTGKLIELLPHYPVPEFLAETRPQQRLLFPS